MRVGHVDARHGIRLGLQSFGPGNGLGFDPSVRRERTHGLHALAGGIDEREGPVGVVVELLHGDTAAESAATGQLAGVIEEVGVAFVVDDSAVIGERAGVLQRHDFAHVLPRTERTVRHGVGDVLGHSSGCVEQVVLPVALAQPRPFGIDVLVLLSLHARLGVGSSEAFHGLLHAVHLAVDGNHVRVQLRVVNVRVAPVQVGGAVVVDEYGRVDVVPTAVVERLADGVLERSRRRVTHGDTNRHGIGQLRVQADVPVELAVVLHALGSPGAVVRPGECFDGERRAVVGPVDHVRGRIDAPVLHPEEVRLVLVVAGIDVQPSIMHHRCRVGRVTGLDDGVLCVQGARHQQGHAPHQVMFVHVRM
ncbi:unknown [Bacteroides sp. CAG:462]|nr:unknown [Bacteroides sp. CAG:462]